MSRNRLGLILITLAAFLALAYAAGKDFWIAKPYTEWSDKEVQKMLTDSPWAKSVSVGSIGGSLMGGTGVGGVGGVGGGGGGDSGGGGGGRGGGMSAPTLRSTKVIIIWYSAPVRQALARRRMLRDSAASKEVLDKILNDGSPSEIAIFIYGGGGMRGNRGESVQSMQTLMADTYLEKKNKEKIAPSGSTPPRGPGDPVVVRFPALANGKPALALEDREVTLRTRIGDAKIQAKFKLTDMAVNGVPAF